MGGKSNSLTLKDLYPVGITDKGLEERKYNLVTYIELLIELDLQRNQKVVNAVESNRDISSSINDNKGETKE